MRATTLPAAVLFVVALAAAAALPACQSKADRTGQSTQGFYAPSYEALWGVAEQEMTRQHYAIDRDESSKENHVMVSRWETQLHQFSFKGYRDQATLYFRPVEGR